MEVIQLSQAIVFYAECNYDITVWILHFTESRKSKLTNLIYSKNVYWFYAGNCSYALKMLVCPYAIILEITGISESSRLLTTYLYLYFHRTLMMIFGLSGKSIVYWN